LNWLVQIGRAAPTEFRRTRKPGVA